MKKIILFITILLLAGLILIGGSCGKDDNGENGENGEEPKEGMSFETAIVIEADNSDEGIQEEYDWLYENACLDNEGVREREMQELQENEGHKYDVMYMRCNNNKEEIYYFQIDSFYGKW